MFDRTRRLAVVSGTRVAFNIPPTTTSLPKGAGDVKLMPKGDPEPHRFGYHRIAAPVLRLATSRTATRSRFSRSTSTSFRSPGTRQRNRRLRLHFTPWRSQH